MRIDLWIRVLITFVAVLGAAPSVVVGQEDHPLVSRYEGSTLASKKAEEFGEYKLVTGRTEKGDLLGEQLKGCARRGVQRSLEGGAIAPSAYTRSSRSFRTGLTPGHPTR